MLINRHLLLHLHLTVVVDVQAFVIQDAAVAVKDVQVAVQEAVQEDVPIVLVPAREVALDVWELVKVAVPAAEQSVL